MNVQKIEKLRKTIDDMFFYIAGALYTTGCWRCFKCFAKKHLEYSNAFFLPVFDFKPF